VLARNKLAMHIIIVKVIFELVIIDFYNTEVDYYIVAVLDI